MTPYQWGHEIFTLRSARSEDIAGLIEVKNCVWPDESTNPAQIAAVLNTADHLTIVAEHAGVLAGFVDCFPTHNPTGKRMEVDLLAVHPLYRGRRLGEVLVREALRSARNIPARALIQTSNTASQITFDRCGFACSEPVGRLYISSEKLTDHVADTMEVNLIEVVTFNYTGIWIEKSFSENDLLAARHLMTFTQTSLAGAVIPAEQSEACLQAEACGFRFVANYQYWIKEGDV